MHDSFLFIRHLCLLLFIFIIGCTAAKRIPYRAQICIPVYEAGKNEMVKQLNDTTWLYRIEGKLVKGPMNQCRCLPEYALIATMQGDRTISTLKRGDRIMIRKDDATISEETIVKINKIPIKQPYKMIELTMEDGRKVMASGLHPIENGKPLKAYHKNDEIVGFRIVAVNEVPYYGKYTWDLITEEYKGRYRVNGIWMENTMQIEFVNGSKK